jgi:hypothetical protein
MQDRVRDLTLDYDNPKADRIATLRFALNCRKQAIALIEGVLSVIAILRQSTKRVRRKSETRYWLSFHTYKKSASLAVATLRLPL